MFDFKKDGISGGIVLALGNFDGLHLGHMKVLKKAREVSRSNNLAAAVMLFDEHPRMITEGKRPPLLMMPEERENELKNMDFSIIKADFLKVKDMSPEDFIIKIYCKLNVRVICCGFNYRYGKNAAGNVETLREICDKLGIILCVCDEVDFEGEPISSTRIRQEIENGNIRKAKLMLGRDFSYCLEVVSGDKRGRRLGFPTINQFFPEEFVRVRYGAYASKVKLGGTWYPSVTNIGIRPTVQTDKPRSETCILGFSGDLYSQKIEVILLEFIRDEKKCSSLLELSETINRDAQLAKEIFAKEQ